MEENNQIYTLNIPKSEKPRIVIIGGGFGGINLLNRLNSNKFQLVLLDRYNYHTFQPLLYQVATAGLEPDSIAGPLRKVIKRKKNVFFRMLKVNSVNPKENTIQTSAGSLHYDFLVIATGARMNYFNNKSISEHAFPLKQVTHALDLRSHIFQQFEKLEILSKKRPDDEYMNFVIVGGGPTGVEVAGALAELKHHVLPKDYPELDIEKVKIFLVEGRERVLPAMSVKSGQKAKKYLENAGVHILLNCLTLQYDGKTVKLNTGMEIKTDTFIWAAGVTGNLMEGFGNQSIEKGKLAVNPFNQVYQDKDSQVVYNNIFAIGDIMHLATEKYPDGLPGLAQVAIQQGKHLAVNLERLVAGKPMDRFKYKDKGSMATIGRNHAVADLPYKLKLSGMLGWMTWMLVHLLFLVGYRNKAIVLANWIWNYLTYDRGIRLILRPSIKENDLVSKEMKEEMKELNPEYFR